MYGGEIACEWREAQATHGPAVQAAFAPHTLTRPQPLQTHLQSCILSFVRPAGLFPTRHGKAFRARSPDGHPRGRQPHPRRETRRALKAQQTDASWLKALSKTQGGDITSRFYEAPKRTGPGRRRHGWTPTAEANRPSGRDPSGSSLTTASDLESPGPRVCGHSAARSEATGNGMTIVLPANTRRDCRSILPHSSKQRQLHHELPRHRPTLLPRLASDGSSGSGYTGDSGTCLLRHSPRRDSTVRRHSAQHTVACVRKVLLYVSDSKSSISITLEFVLPLLSHLFLNVCLFAVIFFHLQQQWKEQGCLVHVWVSIHRASDALLVC